MITDNKTSARSGGSVSYPLYTAADPNIYRSVFNRDEFAQGRPGQTFYDMAADWWWGGGDVIHPSGAPGASYCNPFSKGLGWNQKYTKATTFSAGWGAGGYDFSVQTGNQNSSSMNFKFAGRAGQICGRSGPITQNPGVDVAS